MYQRINGKDSSLNAPLGSSDDNESEWIEWVNDAEDSQETKILLNNESNIQAKIFNEALLKLSPRHQYILTQRRIIEEPKTLEELAVELDLSRERIRQIEVQAFDQLKKNIEKILKDKKITF
jgi:RNA polymerase sigma-32 factor